MINGTENSAAVAAALAGQVGSGDIEADAELFTKELTERMAAGSTGTEKPSVASTMERLVAALGVSSVTTAGTASGLTSESNLVVKTGASQTVTLSASMLADMSQSEELFNQVKDAIQGVLSSTASQPLVNTNGASRTQNVVVDTGELKVVEVQRDAKGSALSVASLALSNDQFIADTLDKLLGSRTGSGSGSTGIGGGNTATTSAGKNSIYEMLMNQQKTGQNGQVGSAANNLLNNFVSSESSWRFQATISATSMKELMNQRFSSQTSATVDINIAMEEYQAAGGSASGMDLWTYMEMMGLCDPLVFDLGDEGINLTSAEDGVYFDIKGDGTPVKTAFIQGNNAFLYLDENGNGVVDDANELFGDHAGHANGFEKLRQYDDNGDGVIDENDEIYSQLRLWRDLNGDGVNQLEESLTLAKAGIKSINLNYDNTCTLDQHGNVIGERSSFTRTDGSKGLVADAWVRYLQ
ncbi:MAG: hypothetical protein LUG50_02590 [Planctomycetaceae bacterium]|nr:hypothetical protein [Planctomycetaceae bacterium]